MDTRRPRFAITDKRLAKIERVLAHKQPDLVVVLENINDPHNLSAVLRSCDGVGVVEVILLYHGGQTMPEIKKSSSASAMKWLNLRNFAGVDDCFRYLRSREMRVFTTQLTSAAVSLYDIDLTQPTALVFGNEHEGVSAEAVAAADGNFLIPQVGMIESLNISVACAVSLYEAYRQRRVAGMYERAQLDGEAYAAMLAEWRTK